MKHNSDSVGSSLLLALSYVAAYVALDWISYLYPLAPFAITPWNPPPGLSIALLTMRGLRFWPAVFVAVLAAELLVRGGGAHPITSVVTSLAFAFGYVAVSALLVRGLQFDPRLERLRDVIWLVVAAVNGSLLIAGGYVGLLVMADAIQPEDAFAALLRLWVGDAIGILVTAPLIMLHFRQTLRASVPKASPIAEISVQAIAVIATLLGVFVIGAGDESRYFYLLFLPLIWVSLRHGLRGAVWFLVAIQLGLVIGFQYARHSQSSVLELQLLMLAIAITGLMLGAAVSERRDAVEALGSRERALEHAMRLASVGELASALAHELNQPLAAIANYVRAGQMMIESSTARDPRLVDVMSRTVAEVGRAAEVVRRLREYFRTGALKLESVDLAGLLAGAASQWTERARRLGVQIEVAALQPVPSIQADRVQIEIVLHNLLSNAADAVSGVRLEDRRIELGARVLDQHHVEVTVRDFGPGLPHEVDATLFQAFATSKPAGMGLGLAISRSIVENHGGRLWVEPLEHGVAFHFMLPAGERTNASAA